MTSDLSPTLLDLLGLPSPDPVRLLDGISLRRLIVDEAIATRPSPVGHHHVSEAEVGRVVGSQIVATPDRLIAPDATQRRLVFV